MNKRNVLLTIQYDGTAYAGWQRQTNGLAIQEVLENALTKLVKEQITLVGSGRTDAGVHALGQAANFISSLSIPLEKLPIAVNSIIPEDIRVAAAREVPLDFNARYSAKKKTYRYSVTCGKTASALAYRYCWHSYYDLNLALAQEAARCFVGEHDFGAFMAAGSPVSSTVRTIYDAVVLPTQVSNVSGGFDFYVTGNGFLYNMVRIMAGTLVEVAQGRRAPQSIGELLDAKKPRGEVRALSGITAPARGLALMSVDYGI